ncbi:hypothetical protein H5410_064877 [Solanum commersonii]|uniref:Uncharacterized protein n=1 Tax=Solanum commersonii TaxID=4109 RepID=A0A9J5VY49_SOLCO|nr:hypothetical protein H5410_064877 [Solanum commersonii]
MRRPFGVRDIDEPSELIFQKSLGFNYSLSHSHIMPLLMWLHNLLYYIYTHFVLLGGSNIPSSSASRCNSLNTSSGSIRLSNLHIESNGSSLILPPHTFGCTSPGRGDRDNFRRLRHQTIRIQAVGRTKDVQGYSRQEESRTPREEERWIEPVLSKAYTIYQEESENLWKRVFGEPIRGWSTAIEKRRIRKKKSWYCGSSSSSFTMVGIETISTMESRKIAYLNASLLAAVKRRRRKRDEKENLAAKSDESDQEGDENDKSDKESEGDEE